MDVVTIALSRKPKISGEKYLDVGDKRIQWGRGGGGTGNPTITFPVPFKDTAYCFTLTFATANTSNLYGAVVTSKTATSCVLCKRFESGGASGGSTGEGLEWIAIGLKP